MVTLPDGEYGLSNRVVSCRLSGDVGIEPLHEGLVDPAPHVFEIFCAPQPQRDCFSFSHVLIVTPEGYSNRILAEQECSDLLYNAFLSLQRSSAPVTGLGCQPGAQRHLLL